jgi:protein phosphatase 2C family protein 2/3
VFLYFLHFLYIYIAKISRAFGDLEAKIKELGGNPKVLISEPEIKQFKLTNNLDFILLGCDGIFDKMTNIEAIKKVWDGVQSSKTTNIHKQCGICVNKMVLLQRQT